MSTDQLRAFRRNVVHVRQALALAGQAAGPVTVDGGYIQEAGQVDRYKRLSIPIRRALNPTDRASFVAALAAVGDQPSCDRGELRAITTAWTTLQAELDSPVSLGGTKVERRQILRDWLEAAVFYDRLDRDRAYDQFLERGGKAAEGMGVQLTDEAARVILRLDEAVAFVLDEPVELPPPTRTPPPPRDPDERWWRRWFG